jgi:hypothetical protein
MGHEFTVQKRTDEKYTMRKYLMSIPVIIIVSIALPTNLLVEIGPNCRPAKA